MTDPIHNQILGGFALAGALTETANAKGDDLERTGWREWLLTLFPFVFADDFSEDHVRYWDHKWDVLQRLKRKEQVNPADLVMLVILGRGMGKSTMAEVGALMRAAVLHDSYLLYVCATDDQAREHIANIKYLIEHPDSRLAEFYPALSEPKEQRLGGTDTWNKDTFITKSGAIFRAKGLNSSMRGLRVGTQRPNQIILDDIDDIKDSVAVAQSKLAVIKASILPVVSDNASIDFPQNLITEHSVLNQIYTGKSDALSERTVIGVTKAFTHLNVSSDIDPQSGRIRHIIEPDSIASWSGFSIPKAQKFLNASGLDTFLAEYQNELDRYKSGKVIPEYNELAQIITWSQFEAVYGVRQIPEHWRVKVGLDVGYSDGQHPHWSAWVFVSTSAHNSRRPGLIFVHKSRTFKGTSIDVQAETILSEGVAGKVESWQMSHEKTGEMMTLNMRHRLPFGKFFYYRAEDGVAQWRHLSRCDRSRPNPFKDDEQGDDGLYSIGCPTLFYIVDDDQYHTPRDDEGQRLLREQVAAWEYVPVKLTESGMTAQKPSKLNDDVCDALKSTLALFGPNPTALTAAEQLYRDMPEAIKPSLAPDAPKPTVNELMGQQLWLNQEIEKRTQKKRDPMEFR